MTVAHTRRLAAVVAADVVGFSRLMGRDEEATLAALKALRSEVIDPKISAQGGRIVKTTGDGLLVEYASVVDALRCWVEIQSDIRERNKGVPDERRIELRVGVNLGDIILDDDDIFGDGVNIAARLETIAAPGGICASRAVVDQVESKLPLRFEDMGTRALKNIDTPVHVYRLAGAVAGEGASDAASGTAVATDSGMVEFPEIPSIAIMAFRDLNGDPDKSYIADGISLGIQTLLVQLPGLFMINAVSHQEYRAENQTAAEAMQELPVRYALEGTVQHAGPRVRVTAQLTDLKDGTMVWADRYDHNIEDIFELQDDITREVIAALNVKLFRSDLDRVLTHDLRGKGAWEHFLRGVSHIYRFTKEDNAKGREFFEKLHELRPDTVHGASYIALTHWIDLNRGWSLSPEKSREQAEHWSQKAIEYEDNDGLGHTVLGYVRLLQGDHEEALDLCNRALEFRSNCPAALGQTAAVQLYCGDPKSAVRSARESLSVRTMCPPLSINLLAAAYRDCGEYDLSLMAARESARLDDIHTDPLVTLCTDFMLRGDAAEGRRVASEIMERDPAFTVRGFAAKQPYRDQATLEKLTTALKEAGLPA